jgi:hypothetical protein
MNMPAVRSRSRAHTRTYGGGLTKFEPNDLYRIPLPNLEAVSPSTLSKLADGFDKLEAGSRKGVPFEYIAERYDSLVIEAGNEAASAQEKNSAKQRDNLFAI